MEDDSVAKRESDTSSPHNRSRLEEYDRLKPLIVEFLAGQSQPVLGYELAEHIKDAVAVWGERTYMQAAVMRVLKTLVHEGDLRREKGWYSLSGEGPAIAERQADAIDALFTVEDTIGDGGELVYVYFNAAERQLAQLESRDRWPCKIGFTTGRLTTRLLQQRPGTSMSRLPVVGLVIKTNDGRGLEQTIHAALDQAGSRLELAVGNEWFDTSPEKIRNWYAAHQQTIAALRP